MAEGSAPPGPSGVWQLSAELKPKGADPPAAATEDPTDVAPPAWTDAAESVRTTIKWMVTAFAAVGGVLFAKGFVTTPKLNWDDNFWQLVIAWVLGSVALLSIGWLIAQAVKMLRPTLFALGDLPTKCKEFVAYVDSEPRMHLPSDAKNFAQFVANLDALKRSEILWQGKLETCDGAVTSAKKVAEQDGKLAEAQSVWNSAEETVKDAKEQLKDLKSQLEAARAANPANPERVNSLEGRYAEVEAAEREALDRQSRAKSDLERFERKAQARSLQLTASRTDAESKLKDATSDLGAAEEGLQRATQEREELKAAAKPDRKAIAEAETKVTAAYVTRQAKVLERDLASEDLDKATAALKPGEEQLEAAEKNYKAAQFTRDSIRRNLSVYARVRRELVDRAGYWTASRGLDVSVGTMVLAAFLAAAGGIGYQLALAGPPEPDADSPSPAVVGTLVKSATPSGQQLWEQLGLSSCQEDPRVEQIRVIVAGGKGTASDPYSVATLPTAKCAAISFTVIDDVAQVIIPTTTVISYSPLPTPTSQSK